MSPVTNLAEGGLTQELARELAQEFELRLPDASEEAGEFQAGLGESPQNASPLRAPTPSDPTRENHVPADPSSGSPARTGRDTGETRLDHFAHSEPSEIIRMRPQVQVSAHVASRFDMTQADAQRIFDGISDHTLGIIEQTPHLEPFEASAQILAQHNISVPPSHVGLVRAVLQQGS